jgi:hypothetical protein
MASARQSHGKHEGAVARSDSACAAEAHLLHHTAQHVITAHHSWLITTTKVAGLQFIPKLFMGIVFFLSGLALKTSVRAI